MKDVLAPEHAAVIAELASSRLLVGLDFDGTLAPIVEDRDAAGMRPRTLALVQELAELAPCVVVSGRARADVAARLPGAKLERVIGNHGLEDGDGEPDGVDVAAWAAGVRERLERALAGVPGIDLEDKGLSLSVHYRAAEDQAAARVAALAAVAALGPEVRMVDGKAVLNVVPAEAPDKGTAILRSRRRLAAERVLFLGDDVTDEDVFALPDAPWLVGVRVGRSEHTAAGYYVDGQARVDELLERLVSARRAARADASVTAP